MVAHRAISNRQVQVPAEETHARMAQGQYVHAIIATVEVAASWS